MAKRKKNVDKTHVFLVLDESGSMASLKDEVITGYNRYIEDMKKDDVGGNYLFSLLKFDSSKLDLVHDAVAVAGVPDLNAETYRPGSSTPLLDAVAHAVRSAEAKHEPGQKVLIAVFTDGLENASREMKVDTLTAMIKEKEAAGWAFIYLGVALEAWSQERMFVGTAMADSNNFASSGGKGMLASYNTLTSVRRTYAATGDISGLVDDSMRDAVRNASNAQKTTSANRKLNAWGK